MSYTIGLAQNASGEARKAGSYAIEQNPAGQHCRKGQK